MQPVSLCSALPWPLHQLPKLSELATRFSFFYDVILEEFVIWNGLLNSYFERSRKIYIVESTSLPNESTCRYIYIYLNGSYPTVLSKWSLHKVDMVQYLLGSRVAPYLHLAKQLNPLRNRKSWWCSRLKMAKNSYSSSYKRGRVSLFTRWFQAISCDLFWSKKQDGSDVIQLLRNASRRLPAVALTLLYSVSPFE